MSLFSSLMSNDNYVALFLSHGKDGKVSSGSSLIFILLEEGGNFAHPTRFCKISGKTENLAARFFQLFMEFVWILGKNFGTGHRVPGGFLDPP